MRILVVDDELPIRMWIAATIRKLSLSYVTAVDSAANGREALELFEREEYDLVLADIIMPVMDGMTLLKKIHEISKSTAVVILTVHDDFHYAKTAISNQAYDYLLKTEIKGPVLANVIQRVYQEQMFTGSAENRSRQQALRDACVGRIISSSVTDQGEIRKLFASAGITLSDQSMFTAAFHNGSILSGNMTLDSTVFMDNRVQNLTYSVFEDDVMIVMANLSENTSLLYQKNTQYEFSAAIAKRYNSAVGVSDIYDHYSNVYRMLTESLQKLTLEFYGRPEYYCSMQGTSYESSGSALEQKKGEILKAVEEQEEGLFAHGLNALYSYLEDALIYDVKNVRQYFGNLASEILILAYRHNREQLSRQVTLYGEKIGSALRLQDIRSIMNELQQLAFHKDEGEDVRYSVHIQRAIAYIGKHLSDCTMTGVAAYLDLSPEYFSRLFRKETGLTFGRYLTSARLDKAADLLRNSNMKVYEVADRTGYPNFGYFSKTFKKQFGCTPFEYRNRESS